MNEKELTKAMKKHCVSATGTGQPAIRIEDAVVIAMRQHKQQLVSKKWLSG